MECLLPINTYTFFIFKFVLKSILFNNSIATCRKMYQIYFLISALIINGVFLCDIFVPERLLTTTVECTLNDPCRNLNSLEDDCTSGFKLDQTTCNANSKYRSQDGSCNNLKNPTWGMSETPYIRVLMSNYEDGNFSIKLGSDGKPKPLARSLSTEFFHDEDTSDVASLITMQWGQIVTHDIALSIPIGSADECCDPHYADYDLCINQENPTDDYFYSQYGVKCIEKKRNTITNFNYCGRKSASEQVNSVTHTLDGSQVYGSGTEQSNLVREFRNGKLKTSLVNQKEFLPQQVLRVHPVSEICVPNDDNECFQAGDDRVNQHPQLTALQVLLLREHNRIATELLKLHKDWDDETIYQETRTILAAIIQHVTYNDWLELYLGQKVMKKYKLYPKSSGFTKYNSEIKPIVINSFTAATFRFGHSAIQGNLSLYNDLGQEVNETPISTIMNRPCILKSIGALDQFLLGLIHQPMQMMNTFFTQEMTNKIFSYPLRYGQDLAAVDILRGRDHGLAGYTKFVEICVGNKIKTFDQLQKYIPKERVDRLKKHYKFVEDIDFYVGAGLETNVRNTRFGVTNLCIMAEQFYRLKWGDRFWYEVEKQPHSFTAAQLKEIKKTTISRLMCDNGDNITKILENGFLTKSKKNKLVDCNVLPMMDLNKWA